MTKVDFKESVLCASRGIFKTISTERNIKIQIFLCSVIVLLSLILQISRVYFITIIISCFLVIILELFNRGFEMLIDLVSPEYNQKAGRIKDVMAGVVLLAFTMTALVSVIILYIPVINVLKESVNNPYFLAFLISSIILSLAYFILHSIKNSKKFN